MSRRFTAMRRSLILAALCGFALPVCLPHDAATAQPAAAATPAPTVEANVALVRRFLGEVVNGGRLDLIDEIWAPDMVWRASSMGEVRGVEAYKAMMRANVGNAFTQMHLDIKDIVASGDRVVVRFTNSGLNSGSFAGKPASHRRAIWDGIGIYRIANGRIAEAWFTEDMAGMFSQLFPDKAAP